jgi:hypothetical protein
MQGMAYSRILAHPPVNVSDFQHETLQFNSSPKTTKCDAMSKNGRCEERTALPSPQGTNGPIWLLNAPLVTNEGRYIAQSVSGQDAFDLIQVYGYESAIGHATTADLLSELLGITCQVRRIEFRQEAGQCALVFRLNRRLEEGVVLDTRADIEKVGYSFLLLRREA